MGILTYDSNNSRGHWWLSHKAWESLEMNGWVVHWYHDIKTPHDGKHHDKDEVSKFSNHCHKYPHEFRLVKSEFVMGMEWLDTPATSASKEFSNPRDGINEWERITGAYAAELGCYTCCGPPHTFSWESGGRTEYFSPEPSGSSFPGLDDY